MLALACNTVPSRESTSASVSSSRSAVVSAERRFVRGSTIANSSPPSRQTVSSARSVARMRRATSHSSRSPAWWPRLSLTCLKSSRSSSRTATASSLRRRPARAAETLTAYCERFARPVSSSRSARLETSLSALMRASRAAVCEASSSRQSTTAGACAVGTSLTRTSTPAVVPRAAIGCTEMERIPASTRKRCSAGLSSPPGKWLEVPAVTQEASSCSSASPQRRSRAVSGPVTAVMVLPAAPRCTTAAEDIPDSSTAARTARDSSSPVVPAAVRSTEICPSRCDIVGCGRPPSMSSRRPSAAAAASTTCSASGSSTVRDSTLTAPTTRPPSRSGAQTSACSPGMAEMNSGREVTSSIRSLRPEATTPPMTPVPGGKPSTTWK